MMVITFLKSSYARILSGLLFSLILTSSVSASVTMLGNRIIYPSGSSSVDVQLKNNDSIPYVIQTWFDNGNIDAPPEAGKDIPFIATPPVFKIQAKTGQVLRVMYTEGGHLPRDRESVFWFNVLQIPPANLGGEKEQNKMLVMLRTRVKLFYRPENIGSPEKQLTGLKLTAVYNQQKGYGITVDNPQPWYASLANVDAQIDGKKHSASAEMLAPFSQQTFWFNNWKNKSPGNGSVSVRLVNDQGAWISEQYHVTFP
ncbi:MAG: fimbrial chaperone [Proteobacteria bacterium]|nr:fimbrial chaperone [Pseudomonadota bacterium]